ncbi:hypothetical protein Nepgr_006441 [Nepenthes gracilis]|uniref:Uncharacterized protein n=1 Tax=Nepenthes gracilis TaxID=150966 RepID=A0AAD3S586_NEPGR|nr:hypothetical protein Nepgr_006441 [Nepenthes gracilis]
MAAPQRKQDNVYDSSRSSMLRLEEEEEESMQEGDDLGNGCGCFSLLFCCGRRPRTGADGDERRLLQGETAGEPRNRETWLTEMMKSVRETSEMVAGPKWKTFIRKMGADFNRNRRRENIQYDSYDYALNFDDGEDEDDQDRFRFSSRFAPARTS